MVYWTQSELNSYLIKMAEVKANIFKRVSRRLVIHYEQTNQIISHMSSSIHLTVNFCIDENILISIQ